MKFICILCSLLISFSITRAQPVEFSELIDGDKQVYVRAISGDGSTVIGNTINPQGTIEGFKWTNTDKFVRLRDLTGGQYYSIAYGVDDAGKIIVGASSSFRGPHEGFYWTEQTGIRGIGSLYDGWLFNSYAFGISPDGQLITGQSGNQAFITTINGPMIGLGDIEGGFDNSRGAAITNNGTVMGNATSVAGAEAALYINGEWVGLGDLKGSPYLSYGNAMSSDGGIVVGSGANSLNSRSAFRWSRSDGMIALTPPSDEIVSNAFDCSADGNIIVGFINQKACIWISSRNVIYVEDLLNQNNIDLSGWVLTGCMGISNDGKVIVGNGWYMGKRAGWIIKFNTQKQHKVYN